MNKAIRKKKEEIRNKGRRHKKEETENRSMNKTKK